MKEYFAHTLKDQGPAYWEPLSRHLDEVSELAERFATAFNAGPWGRLVGAWHDLGKYSDEFQAMLNSSDPDASEEAAAPGRVDHSTCGARHAATSLPGIAGRLLAFLIAGHHAGLTDAMPLSERFTLSFRLDPAKNDIPHVTLPAAVAGTEKLALPFSVSNVADLGFTLAFFARMLFSCLVDADRTATERFCDAEQSARRTRPKPTLADLRPAFDGFLAAKQRTAPPTPVNAIRARVLADCRTAASKPPGFFSLNVPTGGGKTFASLAFALDHARCHTHLRRIVVAIPFTSIVDQTADNYRAALGDLAEDGLLEHHSNLNPARDTLHNKLAAENWDAPLIVTTNVQLYESLFAAKTSPARKLHRLANSVIILDEAQSIPIDLLTPTLAALKELVSRYGCTVVLCTATQPALEHRAKDFTIGIETPTPIIAEAAALHVDLKRVVVERTGLLTDETLGDRLAAERQVLCVVNTKAQAAKLYDELVARRGGKSEGCFHLSTFMCPQHRRDVLADIRQCLKNNVDCRVTSTQLIEAGVDVDFPCVYRAMAGFDSIAQAAGRCNREGKLTDEHGNKILGRVYVFDTEKRPPAGLLRAAAEVAAELAPVHPDPLAPSAVEAYFKQLYWSRTHEWDKHEVMPCFDFNRTVERVPQFKFRTAADAYKLIREEQTAVVVPYGVEGTALIEILKTGQQIDYAFFKKAQQYSVNVREQALRQAQENMAVYQHEAGLFVLLNPDAYSPEKGMLADAVGLGAEALIS